jgi:hypothetical protein
MAALRTAVCDFLQQALPEVHKVSVVKLVSIDASEGIWEAEAEVWQPNPTIRSLQIQTQRPVLDREPYLVRLDRRLNVTAYGLKESVSAE